MKPRHVPGHARLRHRAAAMRAAVPVLILLVMAAQGCGTKPQEDFGNVSSGIRASFVPDAPAACARPDQLSLQSVSVNGSVVNLDLTVTDCDASMLLNGVDFELSFDDTAVDFLGCQASNLFPSNKRAPGTPACALAAAGDLVGTVALQLPNSFRATAGQAPLMRLTFSVKQKGSSTPIVFLRKDALNGSSLFFADPSTQVATPYTLGAAMYTGGTLIGN